MSKKPIQVNVKVAFLGDPKIGKSEFIKNYAGENSALKDKKDKGPHFLIKNTMNNYEFKINIYEYSESEKYANIIKDCQCVFILFDMTKRDSFERLLDNWIIFVRDVCAYKGKIIILGNYQSAEDFLITDEDEVNELIQVCEIQAKFMRIGTISNDQKRQMIKKIIDEACSQYAKTKKNDDCIIF